MKPPTEHVSLILGNSYAARIDPIKLGKGRRKVINMARGGSKIKDVIEQIHNFFNQYQQSGVIIDKVFISVGKMIFVT